MASDPYGLPALPAYARPRPGKRYRRRAALATVGLLAVRLVTQTAVSNGLEAMRSHPVTPPRIGSQPLIHDARLDRTAADVRASIGGFGGWSHPQAGFYGRSRPVYYLLAGQGRERSSGELWREFAKDSAKPGAPFPVGRAHAMPGGLTCSTVTFVRVLSAMCTWSGGQSDGILFRYRGTDLKALARTTRATRTAVNAD